MNDSLIIVDGFVVVVICDVVVVLVTNRHSTDSTLVSTLTQPCMIDCCCVLAYGLSLVVQKTKD